jgi:hypothetical protein
MRGASTVDRELQLLEDGLDALLGPNGAMLGRQASPALGVQAVQQDCARNIRVAAHASITTTEAYMRDKVTPTVVSPLSVPTKKVD